MDLKNSPFPGNGKISTTSDSSTGKSVQKDEQVAKYELGLVTRSADGFAISATLDSTDSRAEDESQHQQQLPFGLRGPSDNSVTKLTSTTQTEGSPAASNPNDMVPNLYRNRVGFWFLGLCNNYGYVVMLSAAVALIEKAESHQESPPDKDAICSPLSTGAILLADILPSLLTKVVSPFINISINIRVAIAILLTAMSFVLTSFSTTHLVTFIGVICASISSGLGEVTFLAYQAEFEQGVVSTWSSGTGMAGLAGAGLYSLITSVVTVETSLLIMLIVPVVEAAVFWILIVRPGITVSHRSLLGSNESLDGQEQSNLLPELTAGQKIRLARPLVFRFMLPLGLVYFFEYFINQGLDELMYFTNTSISRSSQYSWYQTMYQLGVFISRSSVQIVQIHKLWLLPILQGFNVVIFLAHILWPYLYSIYIVMAIIVFEGLLGGAAYVNTFYKIRLESSHSARSFNMAFVALADSIGIMLAGFTAIPVHNLLCDYMSTHRKV